MQISRTPANQAEGKGQRLGEALEHTSVSWNMNIYMNI